MKKCVLIGGGSIGRGQTPYETFNIDLEIVKMSNKEKPTFLFIGLGDSHSDSYYDTIKKIYKELGCLTINLKKKNILNNMDLVKEKINSADIIYIGGGDTIKLKELIINYQIDSLLRKAYLNGTILVGMSAGAILLSRDGLSDSYILRAERDSFEFIDGLGFIDISICPHYHEDSNKTNALEMKIKNTKKEVYGLENCTALKIVNQEIEIIRSNKTNNVYLCSYDNKYREEKIL